MGNIAVIIIVFAAGLYIARHFYKRVRRRGGSTCGCSSACCDAGAPSEGPKESLPIFKE